MYLFTMMTIAGSLVDLYFLSDGFLFALIYIWGKIKPFNRVNLILGLNMESKSFLMQVAISHGSTSDSLCFWDKVSSIWS
jgi:hypothetical protein